MEGLVAEEGVAMSSNKADSSSSAPESNKSLTLKLDDKNSSQRGTSPEKTLNRLYAFDFDHTIIEKNSDMEIRRILKESIPEHIAQFYNGANFTAYMDHIMKHIATKGFGIDEIKNYMTSLEFVPGMTELFQSIQQSRAKNPKTHLVIISDSNTFFIDSIMSHKVPNIKPNAVVTNYATPTILTIEENNEASIGSSNTKNCTYLQVSPYETQTDCDLCPVNLCKGRVLRNYLQTHGPFDEVYYIGDGGGDACPGIQLNSSDTLFVRRGFSLEKIVQEQKMDGLTLQFKCNIVYWNDGNELQNSMQF